MTMKKFMKYTHILIGIVLLFCGCSEEIFTPSNLEGDNVIMSLSYSDVSPKEVVVNTRATDAEEKHLNNLYIYIFNANGQLKGFKAIEDASKLNQNTSSTQKAEINDIKTKVGAAYIYAVANVNTGLYPVSTSTDKIEDGKLPIALDENLAQEGGYDFTLDKLKSLLFNRNNPSTIQISSAFLMSGSIQNGALVNITGNGSIEGGDNSIKLSRVVSKIKFTIKAASGNSRKFKLSTYDIMNISMNGKLISKADGNQVMAPSSNSFSNITGLVRGVNDVDATTGEEFFEFYLPENLENCQSNVSKWDEREDDSQSLDKTFTNAPENGTYVVLKGKYEEVKEGKTRTAEVTYYVHLGDCTADVNNYDVERNCKYTYNVTVAGVDKIIVEAQKKGNEQPGAEGVVMEYGKAGKTLTLDSHYDYMVMRFYQKDIKELKKEGKGYYYQVYALGKHTDAMNVTDKTTGNLNDVDTSWLHFAKTCSRDDSKSIYNEGSNEKGTPCSYPGTQHPTDLYTVEKFLKELYDNADIDSYWTKGKSGDRYIDATCFVDENYYSKMPWNEFVNDVSKRAFYVANAVEISKDTRSVYATTQYGLQQYNIQTFYDRSQAGNIVAYGCETINDEEGQGFTDSGGTSQYQSNGDSHWDGRANMLKDVFELDKNGNATTTPLFTWEDLKKNKSLVKACMSRNRDLNGDGVISHDEVRWYAPAIDQYIGLWIGEEVISTESKLFNKSTSILNVVANSEPAAGTRMLYYTSTKGINTYFSEEGLATHNHSSSYPATYIRCVRNLQSNAVGYAKTPTEYYTYDSKNRKVKLDKVDTKALNVTGEQGELNEHTERSEGNKPASAFYFAKEVQNKGYTQKWDNKTNGWVNDKSKGPTQQEVVEGKYKCSNTYTGESGTWRVPNQRELSMMFVIDPTLIRDTYCRTKFSNTNFRKSWTYNGVFTMNIGSWTTNGSIRCIKVTK